MAPASVYSACVSQACAWIGIRPPLWQDRITRSFHRFRPHRLHHWLYLPLATPEIYGVGFRKCEWNIALIFPTDRTFCCKVESWITSRGSRLIRHSTECLKPGKDTDSGITVSVWVAH